MHAMREIKSLRSVVHENIVRFRQVVTGHFDDGIYLIFDYCEYDLVVLLITAPLLMSRSPAPCDRSSWRCLHSDRIVGCIAI
jgi:serine/threonine protein kinase